MPLLRRWIEQGARYDAKDPVAPLTTILPITQHPPPPAAYPDWWPIGSVAWEPREGRIYVGGYREITVWDGGGRLARRISNLPERISAMEFAPDHARLAVAGGQPGRLGDVRIVDVMAGEVTDVVLQTPGVVLDVSWNPAGDRLAVAAADRSVRVYRFEVDTGRWHLELEDQSHSDWVYSVTWDQAGKRLATASRDGSTKVLDAETGKSIVSYQGHTGPVRTALFAADGDHVFSATADQLHRWKIEDGQQAGKPIPLEGEILALTHFDGHMMVSTDAEKVFQLDGTSGEKKNESHRPRSAPGLCRGCGPGRSMPSGHIRRASHGLGLGRAVRRGQLGRVSQNNSQARAGVIILPHSSTRIFPPTGRKNDGFQP